MTLKRAVSSFAFVSLNSKLEARSTWRGVEHEEGHRPGKGFDKASSKGIRYQVKSGKCVFSTQLRASDFLNFHSKRHNTQLTITQDQ
jgi:hypothetical protein